MGILNLAKSPLGGVFRGSLTQIHQFMPTPTARANVYLELFHFIFQM